MRRICTAGTIMAAYGPRLMLVDPKTGEYFDYFYMWHYSLVGVSYVGSSPYVDEAEGVDTFIDWFLLVDNGGYVYYLGFLEMNGESYFVTDDAIGDELGNMGLELDTEFFCSAYFDGEYLYWSAYRRQRKQRDADGDGHCDRGVLQYGQL